MSDRRAVRIAAAVLMAVTALAYGNSLRGPFVFDDVGTIITNSTIRSLWPPLEALAGPPGGTTASGRPVVNLSLAVNHALGGLDPTGYHLFNLAVHLSAALALFGLLRRTFLLAPLRARFGNVALSLSFVTAALWALHPLQTASVTYIVQRAESLAALFYLLTVYGFLRSTDSPAPRRWHYASAAACLLGMASKEIAVSAPLFVLLYDRTLVAGTFREAWRRRRGYYLALASTWVLLAALVSSTAGRGGSVGTAVNITPWTYLLTQCQALIHYLRLTLWPSPLIFDHGNEVVSSLADVWVQALLLMALLLGTVLALGKRLPAGLAGAAFFAVLAPSSSVIPILTQTVAEHRMYLPLAAVIALVVAAGWFYAGRGILWFFLAVSLCFGGLSWHRNRDYRDEIAIWSDTAEKAPGSKRAHNNLGTALFKAGRAGDAIGEYTKALQLDPRYASALLNLARVEVQGGLFADAVTHFRGTLEIESSNAEAHFGLGFALAATGRLAEGIAHYREALRIEPTAADYRLNLAQALFRAGDPAGAIEHFRILVGRFPALSDAHTGLGTALASQGHLVEAAKELSVALRLNPNDADAHLNFANVLAQQNRVAEALPHYERAVALQPGNPAAKHLLDQAQQYLEAAR